MEFCFNSFSRNWENSKNSRLLDFPALVTVVTWVTLVSGFFWGMCDTSYTGYKGVTGLPVTGLAV